MRPLRIRSAHRLTRFSSSLALAVVVLAARAAIAVEGEDPPEPLPGEAAPAEPTPSATAPVDESAPTSGTSSDAPAEQPTGEGATWTPGTDTTTSDAAPTTEAPAEEAAPPTDAPTDAKSDDDAPKKRRLLDAPKEETPPPVVETAPTETTPAPAEAAGDASPWLSTTGWMALGVLAGFVPVALAVAALAVGVVGFAYTAATPIGAANAAIPFALVGCGLLSGVGLAGPIGSAVVAAVTAASAWTAYDIDTATDVLMGGAPGFFMAGLSLVGLPCACMAGSLAFVYLGAVFVDPTALLTAFGLGLLSAGIGGAAMGTALISPCVTGVGGWSARRAIDHEKDRARDELRKERGRSDQAMAF